MCCVGAGLKPAPTIPIFHFSFSLLAQVEKLAVVLACGFVLEKEAEKMPHHRGSPPQEGDIVFVTVKAVCEHHLFASHPRIEDVFIAKGAFDNDPDCNIQFKDVKVGQEIRGVLSRHKNKWRISKVFRQEMPEDSDQTSEGECA